MKNAIFLISTFTFLLSINLFAQDDPCGLDNSIVLNPGFEEVNCQPNTLAQMNCANNWVQASQQGTTDLIRLSNTNTRPNVGNIVAPPNGTNYFVGIQAYQNHSSGGHHEYLGSCISLEGNTEYTFEAYVGAAAGPTQPYTNQENFVGGFNGDLVVMGLTSCSFPLSGRDCKEDEGYVELARFSLSIPAGQWLPNKIHTTFTTTQPFQSIIIGPSCDITARSYVLIDDIFIAKGNPCPDPNTPVIDFAPCCPPLNKESMAEMFTYTPTGPITAPYSLTFTPTTAFLNQMQAYVNYLNSINPSVDGIYFTWRIMDMGTGANPLTNYFGAGQMGGDVFNHFTPNGNSVISNNTNFFPTQLEVNHWYKIHVGMYLNNGIEIFGKECSDNTWFNFNFKIQNQMLRRRIVDNKGRLLKESQIVIGRNGKVQMKEIKSSKVIRRRN